MPTRVTYEQRRPVTGAVVLVALWAVVGAFVAFLLPLPPMAGDSFGAGDSRADVSAAEPVPAVLPDVLPGPGDPPRRGRISSRRPSLSRAASGCAPWWASSARRGSRSWG